MASPSRNFPWSRLAFGLVVLFTLTLAEQRIRFVCANTPNVLFWDQWDLYNPLFHGEGPWAMFSYQHGPHRQGLGGLATAGLATLTRWDVRGDAILTIGATALAALLALPLARRCGARGGLWLLPVPLIFLTTRQFEGWVGAPNAAHSAFPVLLTVLYGLTWFVRDWRWRLAGQVPLTLFLVFTGFGLFVGALSPVLLALETWHARRERARGAATAAALLLVLAIWALFFHGYHHQPAVSDFHFPHERPWEYLWFVALMFANYADLQPFHPYGLAAGVLPLLLACIAFTRGRTLLTAAPSTQPANTVLALLAAATLLYCVNTAIGRVSLGWQEAPYASRYVTLTALGIFALYLQAESLTRPWTRLAAWAGILALMLFSGLVFSREDRNATEWYRLGRERWREACLSRPEPPTTVPVPGGDFPIHPGDVRAKVDFLRRHRLNLFAPAPY